MIGNVMLGNRMCILFSCACLLQPAGANSTESWLAKRAALIDEVLGPGGLPNRSQPDHILTWPASDPGLQGIVWNLSTYFPINSTVFYKPITPGKRSKSAFFFHHGHSNCVCPHKSGDPPLVAAKCKPGCNSSMPSHQQPVDEYSWWDLYNVSSFFHSLGHDVFVFSMPLKGINLGPGSTDKALNS